MLKRTNGVRVSLSIQPFHRRDLLTRLFFFPLSAARPLPPLLLHALLMQIGNHEDVGRVLDDFIVPNLNRRHNARIMEAAMTCLGLCALIAKVRPSLFFVLGNARSYLIISVL
jgi:hypothetical protein